MRAWAIEAFNRGALTLADLDGPLPNFGTWRGRTIIVRIPVTAEGIAQLIALGWLPAGRVSAGLAGDAVVDIVDRALDLGLRGPYRRG